MIAIIKSLDEEYELQKAAIHPGAGRGAPGMPRKKRGLVEGKDFVWHEGRKMKVIPNTKEEHMKHSNKKKIPSERAFRRAASENKRGPEPVKRKNVDSSERAFRRAEIENIR